MLANYNTRPQKDVMKEFLIGEIKGPEANFEANFGGDWIHSDHSRSLFTFASSKMQMRKSVKIFKRCDLK